MLTLTFAGDESGDVSFSFGKGASRYFVVAMIATVEPEALRQVLAGVRQAAGMPSHYEFSFHALTSAPLRQRVFDALAQADFESWAVVVDKTTLSDPFKIMRGLEFYLYFVTELIRLIPQDKREGATLIMDEFGSASRQVVSLGRVLAARDIPRHFQRIVVKRSRSEPLIQVADLVAGAILRRDTRADASAYDHIAGKLNQVLDFSG